MTPNNEEYQKSVQLKLKPCLRAS